MFKLVIQDDEGKTTVVPLIRDEITIGRKEGNTIRLTERNVSRRHARILRNNGEVHIEDLGSYNGIRVNNARIAERVSLRVSDQVQIGDYKLYLKAEGVEQVDDARTMPIERVGEPTDVMPTVPAAPTTPMAVASIASGTGTVPNAPAAASAAAIPNVPRLVGDPNRTLVAVADTDPQGRPIATPAAISAMTSQVGNGKLVVLSSNFAGKEFELSRNQMIVGRTDENDIVINHRSISRNHAKLVREPDTGRYTVSDLQSSNGVRVNGQDYGKVELRRGDVIDLGHVRLRFVEPGEDFVFSRDAVITDVPETGGKKGLLVAIILGVMVLAGVAIYFVMKGPGDDTKQTVGPGTGTNGTTNPQPDADGIVAVNPPDAQVIEPPEIDAAPVNDKDLERECKRLAAEQNWSGLQDCAKDLEKTDKVAAKAFYDRGVKEVESEAANRKLDDNLKDGNLKAAKVALARIPADSVYRPDAEKKLKAAEKRAVDEVVGDLRSYANSHDCVSFRKRLQQADTTQGKAIADAARAQVTCRPRDDNPPPRGCTTCPDGFKCEGNVCKKIKDDTPPPQKCDFDALVKAGDEATNLGNYAVAMSAFQRAYACRADTNILKRAYVAACNARVWGTAKSIFRQLGSPDQLAQVCMRNGGVDPRSP